MDGHGEFRKRIFTTGTITKYKEGAFKATNYCATVEKRALK
jgi:hypothetical protein